MTNHIRATFISILAFASIYGDGVFAQNGNYAHDLQALESRVITLERGLNTVSTGIAKGMKDTLGFYQETGRVLKESSSRISSLEGRVSELERKQAAIDELRSRIEQLEARMLELERRQVVAREMSTDSVPLAGNGSYGRFKIRRRQTAVNDLNPCLRRGRLDDLKWRVDLLEAKMLELGRKRVTTETEGRRISAYLSSGGGSEAQGATRFKIRRMSPAVEADYRRWSDPEEIPFEAQPAVMRTEVRYYTMGHDQGRESDGRAARLVVLGLFGWWVTMLCLHASR